WVRLVRRVGAQLAVAVDDRAPHPRAVEDPTDGTDTHSGPCWRGGKEVGERAGARNRTAFRRRRCLQHQAARGCPRSDRAAKREQTGSRKCQGDSTSHSCLSRDAAAGLSWVWCAGETKTPRGLRTRRLCERRIIERHTTTVKLNQ